MRASWRLHKAGQPALLKAQVCLLLLAPAPEGALEGAQGGVTSIGGGDRGSRYQDIYTTFMALCRAPNIFAALGKMGAKVSLEGLRTPEEALAVWKRGMVYPIEYKYCRIDYLEFYKERNAALAGVHDFDAMFSWSSDSAKDLWAAIPRAFEGAFGATPTDLDKVERPVRDMGMLPDDWSENKNKVLGVKAFLLFHFAFFHDPTSLDNFDT